MISEQQQQEKFKHALFFNKTLHVKKEKHNKSEVFKSHTKKRFSCKL